MMGHWTSPNNQAQGKVISFNLITWDTQKAHTNLHNIIWINLKMKGKIISNRIPTSHTRPMSSSNYNKTRIIQIIWPSLIMIYNNKHHRIRVKGLKFSFNKNRLPGTLEENMSHQVRHHLWMPIKFQLHKKENEIEEMPM